MHFYGEWWLLKIDKVQVLKILFTERKPGIQSFYNNS